MRVSEKITVLVLMPSAASVWEKSMKMDTKTIGILQPRGVLHRKPLV